MINRRRVLAVVPARGGSKGLKNKNIRPLRGIPLVAHAGRLIKKLSYVDRAIVSTNDSKIARAAMNSGLKAPFLRPKSLSGPRVADMPVLKNALMEMERRDGVRYDVVVMLQPTSPLRRASHVTDCVQKLLKEKLDAVWTVSPTDLKFHPLKQLVVDKRGRMGYFDPRGSKIIARQQLSPVYHRNGAAYAFSRACVLKQTSVMGRKTGAIVVNEPMISIDTMDDLKKAERILRAR
jgi:CMP-N-acetylneuraminic acid synthetase